MSEAQDERSRPAGRWRLLWRLAPLVFALAVTGWLGHAYGTHPVELIFAMRDTAPLILSLPKDGREAFTARITRPDGRLVVALEDRGPVQAARSVVVHTRLPRGRFHVDVWPADRPGRLEAEIVYDGEDALEVDLVSPEKGQKN